MNEDCFIFIKCVFWLYVVCFSDVLGYVFYVDGDDIECIGNKGVLLDHEYFLVDLVSYCVVVWGLDCGVKVGGVVEMFIGG